MYVLLIHSTPLVVADIAISKCWDTKCKENHEEMVKRIDRVANKNKHTSTIEHLVYSFIINGISRACLQELARHRMASLSVKSTRYTLKELKDEDWFDTRNEDDWKRAEKFIVMVGKRDIDIKNIDALNDLRDALQTNMSNDYVKYLLPEAYRTSLVWTINARSLQNFLKLRSDKSALWEIQDLALMVYKQIPDDHKFLFDDMIYRKDL